MKHTEEQIAAITTQAQHVAVVAAPGSGKTSVLAARIAHLLADRVDPNEIAVITFTRSAATEIRERLGTNELGHCGTIHSLALKICMEAGRVKTVIDDEQANRLLDEIATELRIKVPKRKLRDHVLRGKTQPENDYAIVAREYHGRTGDHGMLTYDEVITTAMEIEEERLVEDASELKRFYHVLIDEAQDCNQADWDLIKMLGEATFAIGDPDQALYQWRGAKPHLMTNLAMEVLTLSGCFRCGTKICEAANKLIANNGHKRAVQYQMQSTTGVEGEVRVWRNLPDADLEAEGIQLGLKFGNCGTVAVLARTNAVLVDTVRRLREIGVEVKSLRKVSQEPDIVRLRLWASLMCDPENDVLARWWLEETLGVFEANQIAERSAKALQTINQHALKIERHASVGSLISKCPNEQVEVLFGETGLKCLQDAVQRVGAFAPITALALALNETEAQTVEESTGIDAMTIHGAKGKEWDTVFIVGMEEGVLPLNSAELEEERRVLYVGMTRARHRVILSRCLLRPVSKWTEGKITEPSIFLDEVQS